MDSEQINILKKEKKHHIQLTSYTACNILNSEIIADS